MKYLQFLTIVNLVLICTILNGQSFELPIYFEDSMGNKDSIILGYDIGAGYEIDSSFGEIDLIDSSYVKDFEVRASIYDYNKIREEDPRIIESKKMIIGYVCDDPMYFDEANSIMALIKCNNWPIKISWDKTNFQNTCNSMNIIDCTPGGWFDVCGGGHPHLQLVMKERDSVIYYDTEFKVEIKGDTMAALFFPYVDGIVLNVSDQKTGNKAIAYPNPVYNNILKLKFANGVNKGSKTRIRIYSSEGFLIFADELIKEIPTQDWGNGLYLFEIIEGSRIIQTGKLLIVN